MECIDEDILLVIYAELSLADIMRMKQVSKNINRFIAQSKQLWLHILRRDVLEKKLPMKTEASRLERASPTFVQHLVEYALQLHQSFTSDTKPAVYRWKVPLNITWCTIIRPQYFLFASSNLEESRLSLWSSEGALKLHAEYFVSGPVINGRVYETGDMIVIGITIGSTKRYSQIIGVGAFEGNAKLFSLAVLPDFSDICFVSEKLVLCGVTEGDDTYPHMVNWKTGSKWRLVPGCLKTRHNLPLGMIRNSVCAAAEWMDLFIVIMDDALEIFRMDNFTKPNLQDTIAIATLPFSSRFPGVCEPTAVYAEFRTLDLRSDNSVLHFSYRDYDGLVHFASLIRHDARGTQFSVVQGDDGDSLQAFVPCNFVSSGSSLSYQIRLSGIGEFDPLDLELIGLEVEQAQETVTQRGLINVQVVRKVSAQDLPVMQFTTTLNLDDAAGFILLGTSKGDLCVVDFAINLQRYRLELLGGLPPLEKVEAFRELSKVRVAMDIPRYYEHLDEIAQGRIPQTVVEDTIRSWDAGGLTEFTQLLPPSWLSDWASFKYLQDWIAPASRWPLQDPGFDVTNFAVSTLRTKLNVRGDLIPLAFKRDAEERDGLGGGRRCQIVVFKLGLRLYMTVVSDETDPGEPIYYGALPVQFGEAFNGNLLDEFVNTRAWDNLTYHRVEDVALQSICCHARIGQEVLKYLDKYPGKLLERRRQLSDDNPENWRPEEWRMLYTGMQGVLSARASGRDIDEPEI